MKAAVISFLILFLCALISPAASHAQETTSQPSATFADIMQTQRMEDDRVIVLRKFLEAQDSPMAAFAGVFVVQADINHIPWDLVAAINGTESSFGKNEPAGCNNGWGFGIYGNNTLCFPSYDVAITTISQALRNTYIDKFHAKNVYDIGRFYASSPFWGDHTNYFMHQIEAFRSAYEANTLPISL